jgi:hypothetical protein
MQEKTLTLSGLESFNDIGNESKNVLLSKSIEGIKPEILEFLKKGNKMQSLKDAKFSPESLEKVSSEIWSEFEQFFRSADIAFFGKDNVYKKGDSLALLIEGRRFEVFSAKHLLAILLELEIHKELKVTETFKKKLDLSKRLKRELVIQKRLNQKDLTKAQHEAATKLNSRNFLSALDEGKKDLIQTKAGTKDVFYGSVFSKLFKRREEKRFESYTEKENPVAFALSNFNLWKREVEINETNKSETRLKFSRAWNIWKRNAKDTPLTPEEAAVKNSIIGLTMMPLGILSGAFLGSSSLFLSTSKLTALGQIVGRAIITTLPSFLGNIQTGNLNNKVYEDQIEKQINVWKKSFSGASSTFMSSTVSSLTVGEVFRVLAMTSRGAGIEFAKSFGKNVAIAWDNIAIVGKANAQTLDLSNHTYDVYVGDEKVVIDKDFSINYKKLSEGGCRRFYKTR